MAESRMGNVAIGTIALSVAVLLAPFDAAANEPNTDYYKPQTALRICSNVDETLYFDCRSYLLGVSDALVDLLRGVEICIPDGTTNGAIVRVMLNYIGQHPEQWATSSTPMMSFSALRSIWPCAKSKKK